MNNVASVPVLPMEVCSQDKETIEELPSEKKCTLVAERIFINIYLLILLILKIVCS